MKKLYVGNLAFSTTDNDLREMFAPYGKDSSGRPLTVNEARPRTERSGGPRGGNRSGSRDDYRGHARQPREPRW